MHAQRPFKKTRFLKFTLFFDLKKTYSDKNDPIFWKYCIQYEDQGNIGQGTFLILLTLVVNN